MRQMNKIKSLGILCCIMVILALTMGPLAVRAESVQADSIQQDRGCTVERLGDAKEAAQVVLEDWEQMHPLWPDRKLTVEGDATIRCDEKWISEAFGNLIKNACEHTGEGGEIRVCLEQTDRAFHCTLEDNGGGAAEKDLPHLFDRFYRAEGQKAGGAGLGLAIVKEIIFRHHGNIVADNTAKGLRFTISLPILDLTRSEA